jgi:stage II sporulation protein D (peptidoglycan lytic transglycosylase)
VRRAALLGLAALAQLSAAHPARAGGESSALAEPRDRIEVQLAALAGRPSLAAQQAGGGAWVFERRGQVISSRGREQPEWRLDPRAGGAWTVAGLSYPGRLIVRPLGADGLDVRVELALDDYLCGVLAAELPVWSAPDAQLEAQAIAARSYALAELEHRGKTSRAPFLLDDTRDMAYRGEPPLPAKTRARVRAAVERTRGRVLRIGSQVLGARFHAVCGGHTVEGSSVFPECALGSLPGVECEPCLAAPPEPWSATLTRGELDTLGREAALSGALTRLRPVERDAAGRWIELELESASARARMPFEALRKCLGPERVRSALVISAWPAPGEAISGGLVLRGRGSGHGVGLCQRGARGYAERGWSAEQILAHYYPAARLSDARRQ